MAKKRRRPNIPQSTLDQVRRQVQGQASSTAQAPAAQAGKRASRKIAARPGPAPTTEADLRVQYAYVITDLRNMAVLSGAFLLGLVVLSFFI